MLIIKDAMVLIHLAKMNVLNRAVQFFGSVSIAPLVYREVMRGKRKGYPEIPLIEEQLQKNTIIVKRVTNKAYIKRANNFNIQRGEAESVALYWQEKANLLATDDNSVRKKRIVLRLNLVGTPEIVLTLYKRKKITKSEIKECISVLDEDGWFSSTVIDKMRMEVEI